MLRITVLLICFLFSFPSAPEPPKFEWQAGRPLTWKDFKGRPARVNAYAASTSSGISHGYSINNRGVLVKEESWVKAYFYPSLSWFRRGKVTPRTLRHEQTHFDISELHARILRKRIAEFQFSNRSKQEIKKIYAEVESKRHAMQDLFDQETEHSLNEKAEAVWEKKIATMLYRYRKWAE